jgi:hypothetical protein
MAWRRKNTLSVLPLVLVWKRGVLHRRRKGWMAWRRKNMLILALNTFQV